jgi:hypothetical protein
LHICTGDMKRPVCGLCQRIGSRCNFPLRQKCLQTRTRRPKRAKSSQDHTPSSSTSSGLEDGQVTDTIIFPPDPPPSSLIQNSHLSILEQVEYLDHPLQPESVSVESLAPHGEISMLASVGRLEVWNTTPPPTDETWMPEAVLLKRQLDQSHQCNGDWELPLEAVGTLYVH